MALFTEREWRFILVGVGGATLLAFAVAMIVSISRRPDAIAQPVDDVEKSVLRVIDLEIPDDLLDIQRQSMELTRSGVDTWSRELIDRFWIDPAEIEIESLEEKSDAIIRELFERIP